MCGIYAYLSKQSLSPEKLMQLYAQFMRIKHRGPDVSTLENLTIQSTDAEYKGTTDVALGFHRLAIVGRALGNQPFFNDGVYLMCNGEIYNWKQLIIDHELVCHTDSDCEVVMLLYKKYGFKETLALLDGVFAIVVIDCNQGKAYVGLNAFAVRPLFIYNSDTEIIISSEIKAMVCDGYNPDYFPDGCWMSVDLNKPTFEPYCEKWYHLPKPHKTLNLGYLNKLFRKAVEKRITQAERPIGWMLSGGVDSGLCVSTSLDYMVKNYTSDTDKDKHFPMQVFSMGVKDHKSPDLENARKIVSYLENKYKDFSVPKLIQHHIVEFSVQEGIDVIPQVIYTLECFDQTTVRASTPQYLLAKYIRENTDVKVVISGEGSDELFGGYLYFHFAPSRIEFDKECRKLLRELPKFDMLRGDRVTSAHGLEIRVPFLDKEFVYYAMSLKLKDKLPQFRQQPGGSPLINIEKYILRKAFTGSLPSEILWIQKNGMSDAVGYDWRDGLINHAKAMTTICFSDKCPPRSAEDSWYRSIFTFYFGDAHHMTPRFWLPNSDWVDTGGESSATALKVHSSKN